jgi:hypothetical protein
MPRLKALAVRVIACGLALCLLVTGPGAVEAYRMLAAADDPVQLTDLALDRDFDAMAADREIRAALAQGDPERAQSFVELARDRCIVINPELLAKADADMQALSSVAGTARRFARGFFVGDADDMASFVGTAAGDLLVIGDVRDAAREGWRMAQGEEPNWLVLGLSLGGLGVTVGTFASFGLAAPERAGLSLLKTVGKTERASLPLLRLVRWEKRAEILELAGNVGTIQTKAGGRAAMEVLRLAENPKDVAAFARLAAVKGGKTRAILKFLGRAAIKLTTSMFNLALWVLGAIANFISLCITLKWRVERATRRYIRWRKERRARRAAAVLAPAG